MMHGSEVIICMNMEGFSVKQHSLEKIAKSQQLEKIHKGLNLVGPIGGKTQRGAGVWPHPWASARSTEKAAGPQSTGEAGGPAGQDRRGHSYSATESRASMQRTAAHGRGAGRRHDSAGSGTTGKKATTGLVQDLR